MKWLQYKYKFLNIAIGITWNGNWRKPCTLMLFHSAEIGLLGGHVTYWKRKSRYICSSFFPSLFAGYWMWLRVNKQAEQMFVYNRSRGNNMGRAESRSIRACAALTHSEDPLKGDTHTTLLNIFTTCSLFITKIHHSASCFWCRTPFLPFFHYL